MPRKRHAGRDSLGLTTLEWLLIVAAVAGLAALAVVLVQNVVDDTAEQISQGSARLTAAKVAAAEITEEADSIAAAGTEKGKELKARCERLQITYGNELHPGSKGVKWTDYTSPNKAKCEVAGTDEPELP